MPFSETTTAVFLLQIGKLLGLTLSTLLICFIPGWYAAGKVTGNPQLRTLVSFMVSFVLIYAVTFGAYLLNVDRSYAVALLALLSLPSFIAMRREGLSSMEEPINQILIWLCASLLFIAPQIFIFAPGAPTGMWDWVEHWMRAKIFLNGEGLETKVGGYSMAARGPLFNAIAAFCMAAFRNAEYWHYQLTATALNTWYVLPFMVALRRICGMGRNWSILSALLVGFICYDIGWSIIYPWTKIFTVGLMLGSIVVYHHALEEDESLAAAFGLFGFSIAFLSHYFAFPTAVFFWGHFVYTRVKLWRLHWPTAARALGASAALVSSWFFPCFARLGVAASLEANTTMGTFYTNTQSGVLPGYTKVLIFNIISSMSPVNIEPLLGIDKWVPKVANWIATFNVVHWHDGREVHHQEMPAWVTRNFFSGIFSSYSVPVGVLLLALLAYGLFLRRRTPSSDPVLGARFWTMFWTLGVLMHAATSRDYAPGGVGIFWLYSLVLFLAVFSILNKVPLWPRLLSLGALTTVGLNLLLKVVVIQSEPVAVVNGQAQAALNAKVFSWHIQNCTMKAQGQIALLYDFLGNDRVATSVSILAVALAVLAERTLRRGDSLQGEITDPGKPSLVRK